MYIYICIHTLDTYIYIYRERESARGYDKRTSSNTYGNNSNSNDGSSNVNSINTNNSNNSDSYIVGTRCVVACAQTACDRYH